MAAYVHGFFTAAGYDEEGLLIPAGLVDNVIYAGMLLFVGDTPRSIDTYDVYWTSSNVGMGPLSQSYEWRGQVEDFFASVHPASMSGRRERIFVHARHYYIRYLCGFGQPIHQFWAMGNERGGSDL